MDKNETDFLESVMINTAMQKRSCHRGHHGTILRADIMWTSRPNSPRRAREQGERGDDADGPRLRKPKCSTSRKEDLGDKSGWERNMEKSTRGTDQFHGRHTAVAKKQAGSASGKEQVRNAKAVQLVQLYDH